ncbi:delta-aminolevulinic acid dehydratase [Winogradskyella luteola]|uniref:Delta-aminolevulinic acid dehydratase n=1 Tax=Winogradskyella luteola TaxID=2828330 RepID=A0A9X1JNB9_9FLAO|nr:delta-aminolevulinic acid dehydratase [Winogradskyella luteola]MBV7269246.1 delta-aminolevulinic acid dehydratase [Winogradskyella luteola]
MSKVNSKFDTSFKKLKSYCEEENFRGWDPYDGLNSKLFQATPLKHWRFARLAWIQLFKRNPINLRSLLRVPKEYNSKGISLFLYGYCNLYEIAKSGNNKYGSEKEVLDKINFLSDLLIKLRSKGYKNACWGYNFDWQNRVFYQPRFTPTVVATSFCGEALFKSYEITKNNAYLDCALSSCEFVVNDLNRTQLDGNHFIFSYSPLDNSQVYNASLLGAKLLAIGYTHIENKEWLKLANQSTATIIKKQNEDGSWIYGEDKVQSWIDSFHTGFNLECIWKVSKHTGNRRFLEAFNKGLDYYVNNFFLDQKIPKYYHNKVYPIDTHSPAQLIVTLSHTELLTQYKSLKDDVLNWTIDNMQSSEGKFYYQLKKGISSKIPYMRWAQAWMFKAFTENLKESHNENLD